LRKLREAQSVEKHPKVVAKLALIVVGIVDRVHIF